MVSDKTKWQTKCYYFDVLILVLMEYGLGLECQTLDEAKRKAVLILVLMEYGLGHYKKNVLDSKGILS